MTTEELLRALESSLLIKPEYLAKLRSLAAQAPQEFVPRAALEWLVRHKQLTKAQADRLLAAQPMPANPPTNPAMGDPLDALFDDPSLAHAAVSPLKPPPKPVAVKPPGNVWESPLVLYGTGGLVVLCLLAVLLWFLLGERGATEAFRSAEQDYQAQAWQFAIGKYERFLAEYPDHEQSSLARVHRGLARLHQAIDKGDDVSALVVAGQSLSEIGNEADFRAGHVELNSLLSGVALRLATRAAEQPSPEALEHVREAERLWRLYVPADLHSPEKQAECAQLVAQAERQLERARSREEAFSGFRQKLTEGVPGDVFAGYRNLLVAYPELSSDVALRAGVASFADSLKSKVVATALDVAAATDEPESSTVATVAFAASLGAPARAAEGQVVLVAAGGAAYAIDAATGKVLWRRKTGATTSEPPVSIATDAGTDALFVDHVRKELLRVDGRSGTLRWRARLEGDGFTTPMVAQAFAVVASREGRVQRIDLATGRLIAATVLPQAVRAAPVVDFSEQWLYQLADDATLYVLSMGDGTCREVFYLGHAAGRCPVPPLVLGKFLLVVENDTLDTSRLHVVLLGDEGPKLASTQVATLEGHVKSSPAVIGRQVFVATDTGWLYTFEAAAKPGVTPLAQLAKQASKTQPADATSRPIGYVQSQANRLWHARRGLVQFDWQASVGKLEAAWRAESDVLYLTAPRWVNSEVVVGTYRRGHLPGAVVAAVSTSDGKPIWETRLAVPLIAATPISAEASTWRAVTADGSEFRFEAAQAAHGLLVATPTTTAVDLRAPLVAPAAMLADATCVVAVSDQAPIEVRDRLLVFAADGKKVSWLPVPGVVASTPVAFHQGVAVGTERGEVLLLDPRTGKPIVEPFLPRVEVGTKTAWKYVGANEQGELVLTTGSRTYRLGVVEKPVPSFKVLSEGPATEPPTSNPVATVLLGGQKFTICPDGCLELEPTP